jgi:hypothetical protein
MIFGQLPHGGQFVFQVELHSLSQPMSRRFRQSDPILPQSSFRYPHPARLEAKEIAVLLGFSESDIPILIAGGLLKPLGRPAPNAPKFFARVEIEHCAENVDWLNQTTRCVAQYWKRKRDRQARGGQVSDE